MTNTDHTPLPWDVVEATENHGPYIVTAFGTTVCDLYAMTDPSSPYSIINGIKKPKPVLFTDAEANAALIVAAVNSYTDMLAALRNVNKLISEAAMTGFNCKDGDWAERLFASQWDTSEAIRKAEGRKLLSPDEAFADASSLPSTQSTIQGN